MMSKDDNSPQRFSLIAALRHMGSFVCFVSVQFIARLDLFFFRLSLPISL